ncbi:MAG: hypothetical protein ACREHC_06350 [Candidatus Levyibacteriota bacterium]
MKKMNLTMAVVTGLVIVSSVTATSAFAQSNNNTRPGWGYGDKNHVHVGPPGQSVRPPIIDRLHDREEEIISRIQNNLNIPSHVKDNLIARITSVFDNIFHVFS